MAPLTAAETRSLAPVAISLSLQLDFCLRSSSTNLSASAPYRSHIPRSTPTSARRCGIVRRRPNTTTST